MGICASKPKSRSKKRKGTKSKKSQSDKKTSEKHSKVEANKPKEDKSESKPSTPTEFKWPLEKKNIFSNDSTPGKEESTPKKEELTPKKVEKTTPKRVPIRNPKLYNEDIPIKPAKGANMKSWWNESNEFPKVEHEVTKPVGIDNVNGFPKDNDSKDDDMGFSPKLRNDRNMKINDEFNINSNRNRFDANRKGVRDRPSGRNHLYNDDYTTKSTSSKAPSIIASVHDFDYQPDFLKSKIVAKKPQPINYEEEPRFEESKYDKRPQYDEPRFGNPRHKYDESHEPYPDYNRKPHAYIPENNSGPQNSYDDDENFYETRYERENTHEDDILSHPSRINYNRPKPLVRGQRGLNRADPNFQVLNVQKELKKIITIDESSWKEVIRCQSEISKQLKGNLNTLLRCDQKLLLDATRAIITNSNSGRSNICKNSLVCVGDLFYTLPNELATLVNDAISIVIKKASQGSSDFIRLEANKTLAKICLASAETKLISYLIGLYKYQQSSRPAILNCLIILFDRLDSEINNLRQLQEVAEIAFTALSDGSPLVRNSANVLANIIQEHCDTNLLLNKLHLKSEIRSLVDRSISRYDSSKRDKFIQKITSIS